MTNSIRDQLRPHPHYYSTEKSKADNIEQTYRSHVIDTIALSRIPPKIASPIIWGTAARGIVTAATVHFFWFKIQTAHFCCLITAN